MSLARCFCPSLRPSTSSLFLSLRLASTSSGRLSPIQLQKPANENGFFEYTRDWSRDRKLAKKNRPPNPGNLPTTFMFRRLGHAYELYPLLFLHGFWVTIVVSIVYWSFTKPELWIDRSHETPPWDWENIRDNWVRPVLHGWECASGNPCKTAASRDNYWKKNTLLFDPFGKTHKRLEIMEQLQDEMLDAAKKRGTR